MDADEVSRDTKTTGDLRVVVSLTEDEVDSVLLLSQQPENFPDLLEKGPVRNAVEYGAMLFRQFRSLAIKISSEIPSDHVDRRRRVVLRKILQECGSTSPLRVGPYPVEHVRVRHLDKFVDLLDRLKKAVGKADKSAEIADIQQDAEAFIRLLSSQKCGHQELLDDRIRQSANERSRRKRPALS